MNQQSEPVRGDEAFVDDQPSWMKLAIDLGPLAVFFLANWKLGIYQATGAFMVAVTVAVIISWLVHRTLPLMALITMVLVLLFGTMTLWLHDDTFIKMKPTFANLLIAAFLVGGLLFRQLFMKRIFGSAFRVSDEGWRILTYRWIGWPIFCAVINEIVWRNFTTDFWVTFKVFGTMPLTMAFMFAQMPLIKRYPMERATPAE